MARFAHLVASLALTCMATGGAGAAAADGLVRVERVVMLMRHGVRPPTKDPAMPAGTAAAPWPSWSVPAGWLTLHGAAAIQLLGADDRRRFIAQGVLSADDCGATRNVRVIADSDERTIATADAYAAALAPGCPVAVEHRPQGQKDPLFDPMPTAEPDQEPADLVDKTAGPGGLAAVEERARPLLRRMNQVLCGGAGPGCGLDTTRSGVAAAPGGAKLHGPLAGGATAAQILLLEYLEGKPAAQVGWGRADATTIADLSQLHSIEFGLVARPVPFARRRLSNLAPLIGAALSNAKGAAITTVIGHDTDVAALAGLLDVHWQVAGAANDDPLPGGALMLEIVVDREGQHLVRVRYRAQTVEQIRGLTPLTAQERPREDVVPIEACPRREALPLCALDDVEHLLTPTREQSNG